MYVYTYHYNMYVYIYIYIYMYQTALANSTSLCIIKAANISRFVRVILAQGPCKSSMHRSNFNGWSPNGIQLKSMYTWNQVQVRMDNI